MIPIPRVCVIINLFSVGSDEERKWDFDVGKFLWGVSFSNCNRGRIRSQVIDGRRDGGHGGYAAPKREKGFCSYITYPWAFQEACMTIFTTMSARVKSPYRCVEGVVAPELLFN